MTYRPKPQFWQPSHWQDFELLCWSLWKTIWDDPATYIHGRTGQPQNGIDIYGQPDKGNTWAGVQCKGKENFTKKQLSESELIAEVDKAKKFKPALSEFIIATTAPRDEKIQEVARKITALHKSAGLFPVSVCAWNDIEERLLEHRPPVAKNWYPFFADDPSHAELMSAIQELGLAQHGSSASPPSAVSREISSFREGDARKQRTEDIVPSDSPFSTVHETEASPNTRPVSQDDVRALTATVDLLVAQLTGHDAEGSSSADRSLANALRRASHRENADSGQPDVRRHPAASSARGEADQPPLVARRVLPKDMGSKNTCAAIPKPSASLTTVDRTAEPSAPGRGALFDEIESLDVLALPGRIQQELAVWNNNAAGHLVERLEHVIQASQIGACSILPELFFLIARVHVICAESKDEEAERHVALAKDFLRRIDEVLSMSPNAELTADIEALRGSIENIENGPDAALARLADRTNPYAIRIRLAMHLNKQDLDEAVGLIEGRTLHLSWCDLATTVFAAKDRREDAAAVVKWTGEQDDRSKYPQCVVRLADVLLARALANQKSGRNILPQDLSIGERTKVREVLDILRPVLEPIVAARSVESELDTTAVKIAWQAHHLLGQHEDVAALAQLMYRRRPVPKDVARSVMSGYMLPPDDLPARLRADHPNDLDANILAAVVQSTHMGQHEEAFAEAKKLVPMASTDEKKEELFKLLLQLWQDLEGEAVTECAQIAMLLVDHNSALRAVFDAAQALREGDPDATIKALDKAKAEDDVYCLQLRANALMQKGRLGDAVDLLLIAARKTGEPMLLHKTADLAFQAEKAAVAVECYEQLLAAQPGNLTARGNLASLYTFYLHDIGKAAAQLQALQNAEPDNIVHAVNLATCLAQLYRPEESLALYEEACRMEQPNLHAVLGCAELHLSLGDPDAAIVSLRGFRDAFWGTPDFLLACMNTAHAAGDEDLAHEAFKKLNELRDAGAVDANAFRMVQTDEALEILKQSHKAAKDRKEHIHSAMLKGRMPWVWAAQQVSGDAVYWAWRNRTYPMDWIGDDPVNRANFCIYATNAFHARESERNRRELLPLECPSQGTRVVVDVSALITLHRLGFLDMAVDYFGEILVPEGYLPTVLEDGKKMVFHQRSRQQTAERISKLAADGAIVTLDQFAQRAGDMATADEYGDSDEHRYRMTDLIQPVYEAGLVDDTSHQRISKVCAKLPSVDDEHPALAQFQDVLIELSTLETLTTFGLLDVITDFYGIHISQEARTDLRQRLDAIRRQDETRSWHFSLWNQIRNDPRFTFIRHSVSEKMQNKDDEPKDFLAFFASFVAQAEGVALFADDRVCLALTLNERKDAPHAAFGTDSLIYALEKDGKIDSARAADSIRCLMQWRYRFVLPSASILKTFAEQYRTNPPGRALQETAEYVHDCMRDSGLFGGPENTDLKDSMAMRLNISWLRVIAEFIMSVWDDDKFSEVAAKQLTEWCVREFLPSHPRVVHGNVKVRIGSMTARLLLSHALINTKSLANGKRVSDAMKAMKDALKLSDDEYLRIVTEILNMTPEEQNPSPEDMRKVMRGMQIRMRNNALHHFNRIGPRTLRVLQDLDLFDDEAEPVGDNVEIAVLRDAKHKRRENLPDGPLTLYITKDEKPKRMVVELSVLLFSETQEVRKTSLQCIERMVTAVPFALTPKTVAILEGSRDALVSDAPAKWRGAAVAIYDALYDDVLVALHGTRQSLACEPVIQDSLNSYVPKVLHPSVSSLDSISLAVGNPEEDHKSLAKVVSEIVSDTDSLAELCARYYEKLGFLPFAPQYSMAEAVNSWLASKTDVNAWEEVWQWAYAARGPVPRYHACSVFVLHPHLVPENRFPDLWKEIVGIVYESDKAGAEEAGHEDWALRRDLARHYAYHLEARLPDNNGANIVCFAWWFAEQVAELFPDNSESAKFYRESWVKPASELSSQIWLAASAPIQRSFLRYMTFTVSSPWAAGLLSIMGEHLEKLEPRDQAEEIQARFYDAVVSNVIGCLPFPIESPSDPTFALECSMAETVLKWSKYQPEEHKKALKQLVATSRALGNTEGLCAALRKLNQSSLADQVAVTLALKAKAFTDPKVTEGVWEVISDAEWRESVLASVETQVQGLLIEALSILQVVNREKWFSLLPHYIADLCEKSEDEERRRILFIYVLHTSLASDTVSAVRRLLRGDQKAKFVEFAKEYRDRVEAMRSDYPPWVAGKLRGLIANLHVV